jgi:hypothetical protein
MLKLDINTMTPKEIRDELSKLPRTERDLKKLQDVPLFEYLFTLTGGKIETFTRGKNIGKPKYVAPAGYNYDRDDVIEKLLSFDKKILIAICTLLDSDFYFRELDLDGEDAYLNITTPTELKRKNIYRWYWSMVPFNQPKELIDTINKSTLWTQLYNELLEKAKEVHKEDGFFVMNSGDDYNKYHFELQSQIDIERDLNKLTQAV